MNEKPQLSTCDSVGPLMEGEERGMNISTPFRTLSSWITRKICNSHSRWMIVARRQEREKLIDTNCTENAKKRRNTVTHSAVRIQCWSNQKPEDWWNVETNTTSVNHYEPQCVETDWLAACLGRSLFVLTWDLSLANKQFGKIGFYIYNLLAAYFKLASVW